MKYFEHEEKQGKIKAEMGRLQTLFTRVPLKKKRLVEGLISRSAYMRVSLEEFEADLDENGVVEMFSQSPDLDPYERARPTAQLYNTLNKNYQSIMRQLMDCLDTAPPEKKKSTKDSFAAFAGGRDD